MKTPKPVYHKNYSRNTENLLQNAKAGYWDQVFIMLGEYTRHAKNNYITLNPFVKDSNSLGGDRIGNYALDYDLMHKKNTREKGSVTLKLLDFGVLRYLDSLLFRQAMFGYWHNVIQNLELYKSNNEKNIKNQDKFFLPNCEHKYKDGVNYGNLLNIAFGSFNYYHQTQKPADSVIHKLINLGVSIDRAIDNAEKRHAWSERAALVEFKNKLQPPIHSPQPWVPCYNTSKLLTQERLSLDPTNPPIIIPKPK